MTLLVRAGTRLGGVRYTLVQRQLDSAAGLGRASCNNAILPVPLPPPISLSSTLSLFLR